MTIKNAIIEKSITTRPSAGAKLNCIKEAKNFETAAFCKISCGKKAASAAAKNITAANSLMA